MSITVPKVGTSAEFTLNGFMLKIYKSKENEPNAECKSVYIKSSHYDDFKVYEDLDSDKEIKLTHEEWAMAISSIQALVRKSFTGKAISFIESIGGDEKTVEARKSIFWQLIG